MYALRPIIRRTSWIAPLVLLFLISGCNEGPEPVTGFVLPPGDAERGKSVFVTTGCRYCHTITAEDLPEFEKTPVLDIELGGKVYKVKSYGELLTSIVNPNHRVSEDYRLQPDPTRSEDATSPMPEFNDVLTVAELIDLAEYLHSRYEQYSPQYRGYYYGP